MPLSGRAVFAAATAALAVFDQVAAEGWKVPRKVRADVELVRDHARGDAVATKAALQAAAKRVFADSERHGDWQVGETKQRYYWAASGAGNICFMAASGKDVMTDALAQLSWGLVAKQERVDRWYRAALAEAAAFPDRPAPRKRTSPVQAKAEAVALARIAKALGTKGKLVAKKKARHDAKRTADAATLKKLLAKKKYPVHASVLAFERTFGGLVIPEAGDDDMITIVGAYACLSRGRQHPTGGRADLVPVAFTPNDGILYLDRAGKPYYEDTIEDTAAIAMKGTAATAVATLLARFS